MKFAKILGLAAMALAALMATAGTASATSLTSPSGTTYTSTIKWENEGHVTLTSVFGGFGAITCKKMIIEGKVQGHGTGVTTTGEVTTLDLTECTGGTPRSPVGGAANSGKRGSFSLHGNAELTLLGAELIIDGTAFGGCTFTTSSTGTSLGTLTSTATTGGNATFDKKASIASPCGTGTWEGSYKVVTPSTLYID